MSEDDIREISQVLSQIEKGDLIKIEFFRDGHIINLEGFAKMDVFNHKIFVGAFEINFDEIKKIKNINNSFD